MLNNFIDNNLKWVHKPEDFSISNDKITIITSPNTDLWQKTYYNFINDNAPVLQTETDENIFHLP